MPIVNSRFTGDAPHLHTLALSGSLIAPSGREEESLRIARRVAFTLVIGVALFALAGCIDVVQYISGDSGAIDVYLRLTLQKSAFQMANSFSDDPQDLDQMFQEEFDFDESDVLGEMPEEVNASYDSINNEYEYGFELQYSAQRSLLESIADEPGAFIPRVSSRGILIPLSEGDGGEMESDEFTSAFLGGAKYRLFISKRLVSRISEARIDTGREIKEIEVIDLPDVWLIEFPVILWLGAEGVPQVQIVF